MKSDTAFVNSQSHFNRWMLAHSFVAISPQEPSILLTDIGYSDTRLQRVNTYSTITPPCLCKKYDLAHKSFGQKRVS